VRHPVGIDVGAIWISSDDALAAAAELEANKDADGERAPLDLDVGARIEPDHLTSNVLCPRIVRLVLIPC
jgi:hypothetical protein